MTQPAVQIRHLTKRIGSKTLVEDLTFDVPQGQVFGFLGPNGAGKTTTIRMIMGLISITEGQVLVQGLDVSRQFEEAMRHIGAIVENPEMYKFLTGWQNLVHFARMSQGVPESRIREVVELVGLEQRIHDKVKTYSLGMRQRLGLAQALLHRPSVLILDEPTNGLDPAGIRELRDHLRRLAEQEGIAVIVSSHLLTEMELMCDQVAIIQNGRLVSIKDLREMIGDGDELTLRIETSRLAEAEALLRETCQRQVLRDGQALSITVTRAMIPEINRTLVQNGYDVYSLHTVSQTLEDRFLEVTGRGPIA
ncbi:ABC transporter ATP-binding protein [Tumebacillus sp. DT12]|uniref:ABC transporter ATP-binding protein n=1 Tax=Tumebacillus lacus TaxID=2995335 RepID=A0ABT3X2T6_9BACL|nr:ABC transporter ATP-binding protein [Tumebacillus lacus]MCX7571230.1 ABC transporter ATP-binding protein [Tumebacillus lacus]